MTLPHESVWVVLGYDFDHEELRIVTAYEPMRSTETAAWDAEDVEPLRFPDRALADDLAHRIVLMDDIYWPPVNPVIGRTDQTGRVVALTPCEGLTGEGRAFFEGVAARHDLSWESRGSPAG